jgi:hypothetical protein
MRFRLLASLACEAMSRASIAPSESRRTMKCSTVVAIGVDRRGIGRDNGATGASPTRPR